MRIVLLERRMMILNYNFVIFSSIRPRPYYEYNYAQYDCSCPPTPTLFHILFCTIIHHTMPYPILAVVDPLFYINIAHPHTSSYVSILLLLNAFSRSYRTLYSLISKRHIQAVAESEQFAKRWKIAGDFCFGIKRSFSR
jgi:hypothetical protein